MDVKLPRGSRILASLPAHCTAGSKSHSLAHEVLKMSSIRRATEHDPVEDLGNGRRQHLRLIVCGQ
jgi:hypothetical protein